MASGYGISVSDWLLVAALGIGAYFVYDAVVKPVSKVTNEVANIATIPEQILNATPKTPENPNNALIFDIPKWLEENL